MNGQLHDFSESVKSEVLSLGLHADLNLWENGSLKITRHDARVDECNYAFFDLNNFSLPPNEIYDVSTPILLRDDLTLAVIFFLNQFMFSTRSTKGRHDRARVQARSCIKFFEYCWINGFLTLRSVPHELMQDFANSISRIGWIGVLKIHERVERIVSCEPHHCLSKREFAEELSTNIDGSDFSNIFEHYRSCFLSSRRYELTTEPLGFSAMRHLTGTLNTLNGLPGEIGLKRYPYLNSLALCRALTPTPLRTPNIGPKESAILLAGSVEILLLYADMVLDLLNEVADSVIDNHKDGRFELGSEIETIVRKSKAFELVKFPRQAKRYNANGAGGNYVTGLIQLIMSACFVVLAVCNARRRDEIQHRKYGLHYGSASVFNEELGLYVAEFYIEKTLLDYSIFFVNGISFRAITVLESIQNIYSKVDTALGRAKVWDDDRERGLFAYRRMSELEGIGENQCWFYFNDAKRGYVARFFEFIFPDGHCIEISAHMFRRLYGLLFMYRHELPELQALSYQYQHDCFSATVTYITDPAIEDDLNSIFKLYGVNPCNVKDAYNQHCDDMQESLMSIAKERMGELVDYVLTGAAARGGFTKFLRVVYKKYLSFVEFSELSSVARAKVISDRLLSRGHLPNPFRHSICVASPNRLSAAAHCSSPDTRRLRQEMASPSMCHGCPFQYLNDNHINNMAQDHVELKKELSLLSQGSPKAIKLENEIINLEKILEFHYQRGAINE